MKPYFKPLDDFFCVIAAKIQKSNEFGHVAKVIQAKARRKDLGTRFNGYDYIARSLPLLWGYHNRQVFNQLAKPALRDTIETHLDLLYEIETLLMQAKGELQDLMRQYGHDEENHEYLSKAKQGIELNQKNIKQDRLELLTAIYWSDRDLSTELYNRFTPRLQEVQLPDLKVKRYAELDVDLGCDEVLDGDEDNMTGLSSKKNEHSVKKVRL
ncbi:MAG TPA: hypothetical protein VI522_07790 [Gammaproteobacteria bacterium]|nr:hypothetical protein [Gammaproteobacteria bacterium]